MLWSVILTLVLTWTLVQSRCQGAICLQARKELTHSHPPGKPARSKSEKAWERTLSREDKTVEGRQVPKVILRRVER